jgi:hypothetical protein
MTHLNRGPVLIVGLIMLLAACGGTASSVTQTTTPAALAKGEFVGGCHWPGGHRPVGQRAAGDRLPL